jgi:hypothetical protein
MSCPAFDVLVDWVMPDTQAPNTDSIRFLRRSKTIIHRPKQATHMLNPHLRTRRYPGEAYMYPCCQMMMRAFERAKIHIQFPSISHSDIQFSANPIALFFHRELIHERANPPWAGWEVKSRPNFQHGWRSHIVIRFQLRNCSIIENSVQGPETPIGEWGGG